MANRSTFYVIRIGRNYLHRSHEIGASFSTVTPHLDEAFRFESQSDVTREAARLFEIDDMNDVIAKRVQFETVARHNRRKKRAT